MPDQPTVSPDPWPRRGLLLFVLAAVAVPLGYALYTGHIWEDFFITFRHSQNLCEGKGLVYNEGERVHGFTSPLGVLLPAACYVVTGSQSYVPALWLFRILCIAAFVGGGVLLLLAVPQEQPFGRAIQVCLGLLYLVEAKSVVYTTNGMETAFLLLFLAWGLYLFTRDTSRRWIAVGLCWAGLLWTRPDGCISIAALGLGYLLFASVPRRTVLIGLLRSAAVCAVCYLPWFVGAWVYYGSPVPHTIQAKSGLDAHPELGIDDLILKAAKRYPDIAAGHYRPIYFGMSDEWYDGMKTITLCMAVFASLYWLVPLRDPLGRLASFGFTFLSAYFCFVTHVYPWYMPPAALFGVVAVASGLVNLVGRVPVAAPVLRWTAVLVLLALVVERGYLFSLISWQMKVQEAEIEMGNRKVIGEWLKTQVRPGERVYLEPLGYIGYFSEAHMLDWPGLASPEVVRLRKEQGLGRFSLEGVLRPEWMVLRPYERNLMADQPWFADYEWVKTFDVSQRVAAHESLPGKGYLYFDSQFVVYRRKDRNSIAAEAAKK